MAQLSRTPKSRRTVPVIHDEPEVTNMIDAARSHYGDRVTTARSGNDYIADTRGEAAGGRAGPSRFIARPAAVRPLHLAFPPHGTTLRACSVPASTCTKAA